MAQLVETISATLSLSSCSGPNEPFASGGNTYKGILKEEQAETLLTSIKITQFISLNTLRSMAITKRRNITVGLYSYAAEITSNTLSAGPNGLNINHIKTTDNLTIW